VGTVRTDRVAVMTVPLTAGAGLGVGSQGSAIISAPLAGDLAMGRALTVGLDARDLSSVRRVPHRGAAGSRRIRRGLGLPGPVG
jgi:hypothetical protein